MTDHEHEHTLVWVTSPGEAQARQYCGGCGYRSEWQDLPPELLQPAAGAPETEKEQG